MNEKEVLKMFADDISGISLPPISDRVYKAMRERRAMLSENPDYHIIAKRNNKAFIMKCVFAAMIMLFSVSVPFTIILLNNGSETVIPDKNSITDKTSIPDKTSSANSVIEVSAPEKNSGVLDKIIEQKVYGTVSLSEKSKKELESLFISYQEGTQVYEDERYLYRFDKEGELVEILSKPYSSQEDDKADRKTIIQIAERLFKYYYPERNIKEYSVSVEELPGSPTWIVEFEKKTDNIVVSLVRISFDDSGKLYMLNSTADSGLEYISSNQAVEIALKEIQSGKYDVPDFTRDDVDIEIETQNDNPDITVCIASHMNSDTDFYLGVHVKINKKTGKVTNVIF